MSGNEKPASGDNAVVAAAEEAVVDGDALEESEPHVPLPPPKKRNKVWGFFRPIVIFLVAALIVWLIVDHVAQDVRAKYIEPVDVTDSTPIEVEIPKGASLSQITDILYDNGLINNKQVFKLYTDFSDNASKLKAGTYTLSRDMDFDEIIYTLRKSTAMAPTAMVTFPEGFTCEAFGNLLGDSSVTDTAAFVEMCRTGQGVSLPVDLQGEGVDLSQRKFVLEGYLFPDTYEFYTQSDPAAIIQRLTARFDEVVTEEHNARAAELGMSMDEVVTLASLIEREAKPDQFAQVSAVFHNRLDEGMPLQSDASVSYGANVANRINLTQAELDLDTPYNTYTRTGLPVGPICNPGLAAIEAALYPDQNFLDEGYMYFTLTDPATGVLEFSKTIDEHNAIVEQWRPVWNQWDAQQ